MLRWFVTTLAVAAAVVFSGIHCDNLWSLLAASLLLGIANAFVRPILLLLSLPFIVVSLGLFILVINTALLATVGSIVPGFDVPGFWSAFFGAIIVSVVSWLMSAFFMGSDGRMYIITHHSDAATGPAVKQAKGRVIE
jgi:putative membrane protein